MLKTKLKCSTPLLNHIKFWYCLLNDKTNAKKIKKHKLVDNFRMMVSNTQVDSWLIILSKLA